MLITQTQGRSNPNMCTDIYISCKHIYKRNFKNLFSNIYLYIYQLYIQSERGKGLAVPPLVIKGCHICQSGMEYSNNTRAFEGEGGVVVCGAALSPEPS